MKKLMVQEYIDKVLFTKEHNTLLTQADHYQSEILRLKKSVNGDSSKITEITALFHFTECASMLVAFDEELFEKYAEHVAIHSRNQVEFKLKCGLHFKEKM